MFEQTNSSSASPCLLLSLLTSFSSTLTQAWSPFMIFLKPSSIVLSCEPSCYTPSVKINSSLMSCYFISCLFSWTYQQHKISVKITNMFKCLNRNLNILLQIYFLLGLLIPLMRIEPWIKVFEYGATTFEPHMLQTWNNLWLSTCLKTLQPWTPFVQLLLWTRPAIQPSLLDRLSTKSWFTLHVVNINYYHIILLESTANPWRHLCSISLKQSLTYPWFSWTDYTWASLCTATITSRSRCLKPHD